MQIKQTVTSKLETFGLYWKKPPLGRHMSFREITSLSVGGIGVKFIVYCVQNMILSVGNSLIGNTIGIAPTPLYAIYLISVIASFPLTALRAKMIDSSRSKKGKYRPFILSMGLPTVLLGIAFTWMPYDRMDLTMKCIVVLLFNIGFQFFYMFLYDAYESIINVLSPNTIERSDVCSIKTVTDSFAPTIAGVLLPLLARWIVGENVLFDMRIYRVVYPPMLIIGMLLALLIYANTEEKIVQAKTHVVQIKFVDAFRAIAKNKYFWIISLAGWLGFLEGSFGNILNWLYNYQEVCTPGQYSLITTIHGNASLWPMLFAPLLIRALGKRKILIFSNLLSIVFILAMYPVIAYAPPERVIWLLLICLFVNTGVTMLGHILNPSLNGDIRDYQQYVTGERIDGMFVAVGLVGSVVTLATSFVLPAIYDRAGLNETVAISLGYDGSNVYDVLHDPIYFKQICGVLILASAVGALLNVIPYFFYDLSETKQKAMVTVLKIRALFEDYGNDALTDEALVEAIDLIREAHEHSPKTPQTLSKAGIKEARKTKDKAAVKAAKDAYKAQREENQNIEIAAYVLREINRFDTPEGQAELENARQIVSAGLGGYLDIPMMSLQDARALPKKTPEEKAARKTAIENAKNRRTAQRTIAANYPDGLTEFDARVFPQLFEAEDACELALHDAVQALAQANEDKDRAAARRHKETIAACRRQRKEIRQEIKRATDLNSIYHRAAKPYLDAKKLLTQRENYKNYEQIAARYEESKRRAENERAERAAQEERERAEKAAYALKLKQEKAAEKEARKRRDG